MSDVQQGPGWWQASDGKWYPPESRPQPAPLPPPIAPPLPGIQAQPPRRGAVAPPPPFVPALAPHSVSTGLSATIQGFFWSVGALSLVSAILAVATLLAFNNWWDAPINSRAEAQARDDWSAIEDVLVGFTVFVFLGAFVLWILLMVWMNSSHKATQQLWSGVRQWSSGWTIGAWFIPVANLIMPMLVLSEIERIATAPRSGGVIVDPSWKSRAGMAIGKLWWIAFVVGIVVVTVGDILALDDDASAGEVRAKYVCYAIGLVLLAASAAWGALYVRRIGKRLSAEGLGEPS